MKKIIIAALLAATGGNAVQAQKATGCSQDFCTLPQVPKATEARAEEYARNRCKHSFHLNEAHTNWEVCVKQKKQEFFDRKQGAK